MIVRLVAPLLLLLLLCLALMASGALALLAAPDCVKISNRASATNVGTVP